MLAARRRRWLPEGAWPEGVAAMATQLSPVEILRDHVTLEIECIDRMYLNLFVQQLQVEGAATESR